MLANHKPRLTIFLALLVVSVFLISGQIVLAAIITVDGTCTLVEAITAANTDTATPNCPAGAGADTIILDADVNLVAGVGANVDGGQSGTPDITTDITIQAGDAAIISGNSSNFRIFNVAAGGTLTLVDVVVQNGRIAPATGERAYGGGIRVANGGILNLRNSVVTNNAINQPNNPIAADVPNACGGGIYNAGTLSVVNSTISNNEVRGPGNLAGPQPNTFGGGIYNTAYSNVGGVIGGLITTIEYSTIDNNLALGGTGGTTGHAFGGGIHTAGNLNSLTNSTISNNDADSLNGLAFGGGINFLNFGSATLPTIGPIENVTFSDNYAREYGGAMEVTANVTLTNVTLINNRAANIADAIRRRAVAGSAVTLVNTIISSPGGNSDCDGTITNGGNNLRNPADATCGAALGTITVGTDIDAALADNGGPTRTHALLTGSVAIDAANNGNCPANDQRDVVRGIDGNGIPNNPQPGDCDIGAYEYANRTLAGFVWRDLSGNGVQNTGEPGVDGVTVTLSTGETTTTDHGGYYIFTGLASSTPTITFTAPAGYTFTLQDVGGDNQDSDPDPLTSVTIPVDLTGAAPVLAVNWDAGLIPLSDLTVAKSNSVGGLVAVSSSWDWVLDVALSDDGTSAIFPIGSTLLTDTLPAGPTYPATATTATTSGTVAGTITCTIAADVLTCTATTAVTMNPNSSFQVTIAGITAPVGTYDNLAADCMVDPPPPADGNVPEGDETNNNCAADDAVTVVDQLTIVKQFTDDPVLPGDTVTLEFTILNPDPTNAATGITFTDDLDATLTGLVATGLPAANVCGAGSTLTGAGLITLTGGNLVAGDSCTFSVVLQVPAGATLGSYPNTTSNITGTVGGVAVTGTPATDTLVVGFPTSGGGSGGNGGGGQAGSTLVLFDPALSKIGFLEPGQVGLLGERIEWQVTVVNTGGVTGTNIIITDTLPDGLRIDRVSSNVSSSVSGQTVTVTIPTLNIGQSITFSIFTTVIDSDLTVVNIACLTADNNSQDICATGMVARELPSTGETPWWAGWLHQGHP